MRTALYIASILVASSQALSLEKFSPDTGAPIPICNGANDGQCTEANDVVVHRVRRPHKRAAKGDPDFPAQEANDKSHGSLVQFYQPTCTDAITTECQPVCNEGQTTGCTENRTPDAPREGRFDSRRIYKQW